MNKKKKTFPINILCLMMLLNLACVSAQPNNPSIGRLEEKLDSLIPAAMESEHIPGLAFIIVKDGKTILKKGYGYTSLGEDIHHIRPDSTIFRIGSITKSFTALALLQLADQGRIDLHTDVNKYLKWVKVPETFDEPVTPIHLITHSAGFDELRGRLVFQKDQLIPLDSFLNGRLIRLRPPGDISSYSTFGIALAGLLVENVSGMSLEEYMKKNIWEPMGMGMTSIDLPEEHEDYVTLGYEYRQGVNVPQPWEWYHTFPASSINSTMPDMGKYLQMLLNKGVYNEKRILSEKMAMAMLTQQLSVHPDIRGFSYGLYEENVAGLKTINHGGDMLGYCSYMSLAPEINMGLYVAHHHEGTRMRYQVMEAILGHFGKAPIGQTPATDPERLKQDLTKFIGHYRWTTYCHSCGENHYPNAREVTANEDHTLSGFGRKFYQVEPLLFKSYDGERVMGFVEDEHGVIQFMSMGNINTFEKID